MKKIIFITILILATTGIASAAGYTLLQPLGGPTAPTTVNLSQYIQQMIKISIVFAGLMAVVMIVIGGFTYITAGGGSGKEKGKDFIWNAVIGIIIAVSFYIILYAINPDILNTDGIIKPIGDVREGQVNPATKSGQWTEVPMNKYCKDILGDGWVNVDGSNCNGSSPGTIYSCCEKQ